MKLCFSRLSVVSVKFQATQDGIAYVMYAWSQPCRHVKLFSGFFFPFFHPRSWMDNLSDFFQPRLPCRSPSEIIKQLYYFWLFWITHFSRLPCCHIQLRRLCKHGEKASWCFLAYLSTCERGTFWGRTHKRLRLNFCDCACCRDRKSVV